ncbi:hypothetical protein LB507_000449 [Fusarium sp. FIESC RH6]|nr:hypothetical protein LB507_000449 [Fusarium sp. FIESC RH6]
MLTSATSISSRALSLRDGTKTGVLGFVVNSDCERLSPFAVLSLAEVRWVDKLRAIVPANVSKGGASHDTERHTRSPKNST